MKRIFFVAGEIRTVLALDREEAAADGLGTSRSFHCRGLHVMGTEGRGGRRAERGGDEDGDGEEG